MGRISHVHHWLYCFRRVSCCEYNCSNELRVEKLAVNFIFYYCVLLQFFLIVDNVICFSKNCTPQANAVLSSTTPEVSPGTPGLILIRLKFPPLSRSTYKLLVTSPEPNIIGICQVFIIYLGYNFPCVDPNPIAGNISRLATTRITYQDYSDVVNASRLAVLDFGSMSNLGKQITAVLCLHCYCVAG